MKRQITTVEEQYIKVYSPSWCASGQGFSDIIEGDIYFDEPYINEEQANALLEKANQKYNELYSNSWVKEPEIRIYWKTITTKTIDIK